MVDGAGRFLGGTITPDKSSEVCAARPLLRQEDLSGRIVVADALHTNVATAQQILFEQGGDFLLTVKGNQPTVHKNLEALFANRAFSPSAHVPDPHHCGGEEPQPGGNPWFGCSGGDPPVRCVFRESVWPRG